MGRTSELATPIRIIMLWSTFEKVWVRNQVYVNPFTCALGQVSSPTSSVTLSLVTSLKSSVTAPSSNGTSSTSSTCFSAPTRIIKVYLSFTAYRTLLATHYPTMPWVLTHFDCHMQYTLPVCSGSMLMLLIIVTQLKLLLRLYIQ